jgi:malate dehydrogenase (oxaloacetate-decarboxylating)
MDATQKKIIASFKKQGARVETRARVTLKDKKDFSLWYTPGVATAAMHIAKNPQEARSMSVKKNSVAIVCR